MTTLPPGSKLCAGLSPAVTCSRREHCARYVEALKAGPTERVHASLCPGRDDYWPHYIKAVQS